MPLATGTRLGAYEVLGPIGAGGMGEVYRARDTRLDRTVAIKILPSHVAADATAKQRFEREAKALAALSHPHICAIFDVGQAETSHGAGTEARATDFLVMEYLEGETLAQRLARGALPANEALRYGTQIADALDKAHKKAIVHRDLKPANVMLTAGGVKLLDFGLAKAVAAPSGTVDLTAAPTITSPLTGAGSIVGTFQYMAPEQIEGQDADARTDIFAFGAVLHEMLTGTRAFEGKTQASLIGAILERNPVPVSSVQPMSPPALDQIVATCLAKRPDDRWQSAADVGRQLKWILDGGSQPSATAPVPALPARPKRSWAGLAAAAAALVVVALGLGSAGWRMTRPATAPTVTRFLLAPSPTTPLVNVGGVDVLLSPDGQRIVFLGRRQGGYALFVRELNALDARMIAGTELPQNFGVANPFLSWDGSAVVFRSPGAGIMKVPIAGGAPVKVADDSARFLGGAWGPDDTLVLALGDGLYRTSASGGTPFERVSALADAAGEVYIAPVMLPDGKAVLFFIADLKRRTGHVGVLDLETREQRVLVDGASEPKYIAPGYLVFAQGTTLMAAPFDAPTRTITGPAVAVQEGVQHPALLTATDYGVSDNGTLIYVPALETRQPPTATPVWVDRTGRQVGPVVESGILNARQVRLAPDGRRLVVVTSDGRPQGDTALWVYDLAGRPPIPLSDRGTNQAALWSPDGARVVFTSNRAGPFGVYSLAADGGTAEPTLVPLGVEAAVRGLPAQQPRAWMPDGRLVFANSGIGRSGGAVDLLIAPAGPGASPEPLVQTEYAEDQAAVSPDGRWVAYRSNRTGQQEIWVRALTGGAPARVSQNGGTEPVWSRDGRELFYLEGDKMMAVAVKASGSEFAFTPAVMLFDASFRGGVSYDVAADGRFVMIPRAANAPPTAPVPQGIVVVQNWVEELKRLVPAR